MVKPQNVCWPMAGTFDSVILISSNCLNCEKIGPIVMEFFGPRIIRIVTLASKSASGKCFNPPVNEWYESLMIDSTLFIYLIRFSNVINHRIRRGNIYSLTMNFFCFSFFFCLLYFSSWLGFASIYVEWLDCFYFNFGIPWD